MHSITILCLLMVAVTITISMATNREENTIHNTKLETASNDVGRIYRETKTDDDDLWKEVSRDILSAILLLEEGNYFQKNARQHKEVNNGLGSWVPGTKNNDFSRNVLEQQPSYAEGPDWNGLRRPQLSPILSVGRDIARRWSGNVRRNIGENKAIWGREENGYNNVQLIIRRKENAQIRRNELLRSNSRRRRKVWREGLSAKEKSKAMVGWLWNKMKNIRPDGKIGKKGSTEREMNTLPFALLTDLWGR